MGTLTLHYGTYVGTSTSCSAPRSMYMAVLNFSVMAVKPVTDGHAVTLAARAKQRQVKRAPWQAVGRAAS